MARVHGEEHFRTLTARHNLAYWRGAAGDTAGAATTLAELLQSEIQALGPDHPRTLNTRHNLTRWREEAGDAAVDHSAD
ncbi:hypothetical protein AB0I22_19815 [Streptomyces sp. NPDC050610]|uniref:hypothetical protein n=1 Tax=Streptomyces sp. NPDC050610 TaxID=3157097 RepID=UPI00342CBD85